jgi:mitochondrial fission protein ELM1
MKVWAILGARLGDNNQVLALAEALDVPFEIKQLRYNGLRHLGPKLLGATLCSLARASRAAVSSDLPDLTISTGHRSVPVVQALRRRSKGRTRSIHVGYPRISPANFDLVVATPEYPIADHPNLLRIPIALARARLAARGAAEAWRAHPRPRRLLILGGPTLYWALRWPEIRNALDELFDMARRDGGSVVIAASPRTPHRLLANVRATAEESRVAAMVVPVGGLPPYGALLDHADTIAVTADSVAMTSDAIAAGKPVTLVPVVPTLGGRLAMALNDRLRPGQRIHPRDLRFFWRSLSDHGLAGTVDKAACANPPDFNRLVAGSVMAVLNHRNC